MYWKSGHFSSIWQKLTWVRSRHTRLPDTHQSMLWNGCFWSHTICTQYYTPLPQHTKLSIWNGSLDVNLCVNCSSDNEHACSFVLVTHRSWLVRMYWIVVALVQDTVETTFCKRVHRRRPGMPRPKSILSLWFNPISGRLTWWSRKTGTKVEVSGCESKWILSRASRAACHPPQLQSMDQPHSARNYRSLCFEDAASDLWEVFRENTAQCPRDASSNHGKIRCNKISWQLPSSVSHWVKFR